MNKLILLILVLFTLPFALAIGVETDKQNYQFGEDVIISAIGCDGVGFLKVFNDNGLIYIDQGTDTFLSTYSTNSDEMPGEYLVKLSCNGEESQTTFLVGEPMGAAAQFAVETDKDEYVYGEEVLISVFGCAGVAFVKISNEQEMVVDQGFDEFEIAYNTESSEILGTYDVVVSCNTQEAGTSFLLVETLPDEDGNSSDDEPADDGSTDGNNDDNSGSDNSGSNDGSDSNDDSSGSSSSSSSSSIPLSTLKPEEQEPETAPEPEPEPEPEPQDEPEEEQEEPKEEKPSSFNWLTLILILAILGIGGFGTFYAIKHKPHKEPHTENTSNLANAYVQSQLSKGVSQQQIKQNLENAGWSEEQVNNVFKGQKKE